MLTDSPNGIPAFHQRDATSYFGRKGPSKFSCLYNTSTFRRNPNNIQPLVGVTTSFLEENKSPKNELARLNEIIYRPQSFTISGIAFVSMNIDTNNGFCKHNFDTFWSSGAILGQSMYWNYMNYCWVSRHRPGQTVFVGSFVSVENHADRVVKICMSPMIRMLHTQIMHNHPQPCLSTCTAAEFKSYAKKFALSFFQSATDLSKLIGVSKAIHSNSADFNGTIDPVSVLTIASGFSKETFLKIISSCMQTDVAGSGGLGILFRYAINPNFDEIQSFETSPFFRNDSNILSEKIIDHFGNPIIVPDEVKKRLPAYFSNETSTDNIFENFKNSFSIFDSWILSNLQVDAEDLSVFTPDLSYEKLKSDSEGTSAATSGSSGSSIPTNVSAALIWLKETETKDVLNDYINFAMEGRKTINDNQYIEFKESNPYSICGQMQFVGDIVSTLFKIIVDFLGVYDNASKGEVSNQNMQSLIDLNSTDICFLFKISGSGDIGNLNNASIGQIFSTFMPTAVNKNVICIDINNNIIKCLSTSPDESKLNGILYVLFDGISIARDCEDYHEQIIKFKQLQQTTSMAIASLSRQDIWAKLKDKFKFLLQTPDQNLSLPSNDDKAKRYLRALRKVATDCFMYSGSSPSSQTGFTKQFSRGLKFALSAQDVKNVYNLIRAIKTTTSNTPSDTNVLTKVHGKDSAILRQEICVELPTESFVAIQESDIDDFEANVLSNSTASGAPTTTSRSYAGTVYNQLFSALRAFGDDIPSKTIKYAFKDAILKLDTTAYTWKCVTEGTGGTTETLLNAGGHEYKEIFKMDTEELPMSIVGHKNLTREAHQKLIQEFGSKKVSYLKSSKCNTAGGSINKFVETAGAGNGGITYLKNIP